MRILVSLLSLGVFSVMLLAQAPKQAPREPTNLKVLKIPGAEVLPMMQTFTAGLGVQCGFCHAGRDFASDDNPKKETARHMISMAQQINAAAFPDGKTHVTCYTCHRGEVTPKMSADAKPAQ